MWYVSWQQQIQQRVGPYLLNQSSGLSFIGELRPLSFKVIVIFIEERLLIPGGCFAGWLYYCLFFLSPPHVVLRICLLC